MTELEEKKIKELQATTLMLKRTEQEIKERGNKPTMFSADPLKDVSEVTAAVSEFHTSISGEEYVPSEEELGAKQEIAPPPSDAPTKSVGTTQRRTPRKHASGKLPDISGIEVDRETPYDFVQMPSRGECYKSKKEGFLVSYLTAADEDQIMQPALYKDGYVYQAILKRKITDAGGMLPGELVPADRDAIILWLRLTGYGKDYAMSVMDPETGKQFETFVDLTTIGYKPFTLKGDENGFFEFTLPVVNGPTADVVKFKYLSIDEEMEWLKYVESTNSKLLSYKLTDVLNNIDGVVTFNDSVTDDMEDRLRQARNLVDEALDEVIQDEEFEIDFNTITKRLSMHVQSYNGNADRAFIERMCRNMRVGNSLALREYIKEHEPRVDFEVEVERPADLGGGSFITTFPFNDLIFFNAKQRV